MGANWVHIFSPSIVNSARIGFTRTDWTQGFPEDPTGEFGTSGNAKVGITFNDQRFNGFSYQSIGGGISGVGTPAFDGGIIDNTYSYIDNVTWQRGKHTLSLGVQALRYQNNYPTSNNNGYLGSLTYNGAIHQQSFAEQRGRIWRGRFSAGPGKLGSGNAFQRERRTAAMADGVFRQRRFQSHAQPDAQLRRALGV